MSIEHAPGSEVLEHRDELPHTRLSLAVDSFFDRLAGAVSWVWVILMAVIVVNVAMRYLFGEGRIEFEEIQWHLYAVGFLVGLSTCLATDNHVRVDVINERLSPRKRAWVELYGLLLLFFPFVIFVLLYSLPFVEYSFTIGEVSDAPGGLPFRWLIKAVLTLAMLLLVLAGAARILRVTSLLFGSPRATGRTG